MFETKQGDVALENTLEL